VGDNPSYDLVTYSDIEGGWPGVGNINEEPQFRNPMEGDFRLMSRVCGDLYDSSCIDAGHPDSVDVLLDCDHGFGTTRPDIWIHGDSNIDSPVGIKIDWNSGISIPKDIALFQNYPNPFNPSTTINYTIPDRETVIVKLFIYNLRGQIIKTLVNERKQSGSYSVYWGGRNDQDRGVGSGIFIYKIMARSFSSTKKMVILR